MHRKLPPNLYERKYKTRAGYSRVLYYPRIRCWDGNRRTFKGVEDFAAAKAELARLLDLNRQRLPFDAPAKAGKLFHWIERFLAVKASKRSADRDKISARWIKEFFGDCELTAIAHSKTLEYRNQREVSESTKNRELAFLRGVLYLAHRDGQLAKMPDMIFTREHNERIRTATEIELCRILKTLAASNPDICDVVTLLKETGFRVGEVLRLEARDLMPRSQAIEMKRIRSKGGLVRALPMSKAAWRVLEARTHRNPRKLFPDLSRWNVYDAFQAACKAHNIDGLWLHDIRGTFVTEKERQGWPRKIITEYTGHRKEDVFRRYSRPTDSDLKRFVGQRSGNMDKLKIVKLAKS